MNGQATKPVGRTTIENLTTPEARTALTLQPYYFCDAPECDTVHVSTLGDHLITKDMLSVRGGLKETEDPIPRAGVEGQQAWMSSLPAVRDSESYMRRK